MLITFKPQEELPNNTLYKDLGGTTDKAFVANNRLYTNNIQSIVTTNSHISAYEDGWFCVTKNNDSADVERLSNDVDISVTHTQSISKMFGLSETKQVGYIDGVPVLLTDFEDAGSAKILENAINLVDLDEVELAERVIKDLNLPTEL